MCRCINTHTPHYAICNYSVTHIHHNQCVYSVFTLDHVNLGKLQTSRWMFRAVGPHQCSAAQQNPYQTTQSHTIHQHPLDHATHSNGLPSNAHTIPTHACPHTPMAILHPWLITSIYATTHAHTSAHSIMHPQCLTCQRNMCCTQMHMYLHIHTAHLCGTLSHKHSTHAQNMNTCLCWCTHKHTHMYTHFFFTLCPHGRWAGSSCYSSSR